MERAVIAGASYRQGGAVIPDGCQSVGGVIGGQVGYRWQAGQFVFGLEGQGDWASMRSSHVSVVNPLLTDSSKVTSLGLFTGQVGYASERSVAVLERRRGGDEQQPSSSDHIWRRWPELCDLNPLGRRHRRWVRIRLHAELVGSRLNTIA